LKNLELSENDQLGENGLEDIKFTNEMPCLRRLCVKKTGLADLDELEGFKSEFKKAHPFAEPVII